MNRRSTQLRPINGASPALGCTVEEKEARFIGRYSVAGQLHRPATEDSRASGRLAAPVALPADKLAEWLAAHRHSRAHILRGTAQSERLRVFRIAERDHCVHSALIGHTQDLPGTLLILRREERGNARA